MKKIIFILLLSPLFFIVNAQTVSDYYHTTANFYINGQKKAAKKTIQEALSKYPNDPKLNQLSKSIDKLPEDKDDKKNQEKKDQEKKDQDKKDQDKQNQDKKDQDKKDKDKQNQPQQQKPQMTKQNAQQILDALMQDEKNTQDKAKKQQARGVKSADKDW